MAEGQVAPTIICRQTRSHIQHFYTEELVYAVTHPITNTANTATRGEGWSCRVCDAGLHSWPRSWCIHTLGAEHNYYPPQTITITLKQSRLSSSISNNQPLHSHKHADGGSWAVTVPLLHETLQADINSSGIRNVLEVAAEQANSRHRPGTMQVYPLDVNAVVKGSGMGVFVGVCGCRGVLLGHGGQWKLGHWGLFCNYGQYTADLQAGGGEVKLGLYCYLGSQCTIVMVLPNGNQQQQVTKTGTNQEKQQQLLDCNSSLQMLASLDTLGPGPWSTPPCALISHTWQSTLQLHYQVKKLLAKLIYSESPIAPNSTQGSHYLIALSAGQQPTSLLVVYNREAIISDAIDWASGVRRADREWLWGQLEWLAAAGRLKYPHLCYVNLMHCYCELALCGGTRGQFCCLDCEGAVGNIDRLTRGQKMKLCKYMLAQNITPSSQQSLCGKSDSEATTSTILGLPDENLNICSSGRTVVVYWALGLNGQELYTQVIRQYSDYRALTLHIDNVEELLDKCGFVLSNDWPAQIEQNYCFIFISGRFSQSGLQQLTQALTAHLHTELFSQVLLISPPVGQASKFYNQFDLQAVSTCPEWDSSQENPRMVTTYHFSIDFMLASVLRLQRGQHGSSQALAQHMHYMSSTYCNLNLGKLCFEMQPAGGVIRVLEYTPRHRIRWDLITEEEREEITDQLKVLLEMSYKQVTEEDALLAYFVTNLDNLQYEWDLMAVGRQLVEATFPVLPYYQFSTPHPRTQ